MKIYISDLAYVSEINFIHPLPLNAGFIASYTLKHLPDLDIKIFKSPAKLLDAVSENPPDILAMTHYAWNANLDMAMATRCKQMHPGLKIVMGGPNFVCDDDREWMERFFRTRPFLDLYIVGEGEYSFLKYLEILSKKDLDLTKSDFSIWPSTFYSFDHEANQIINNPSHPVDRLDLTAVPSPYLSGLLDEFVDDDHLTPIIETNRGCPYACSFCVWGQVKGSQVRQFDLQTVIDEIHYISERSKNPTKVFYIADANFGMLKRDVKIAEALMECHHKYGFPQRLYIYSAKLQTKNSIQTFEIISPIASMSMSLQSTNKDVLEFIGRRNIGLENYERNRVECERRGINTYCELIYGLPGESYESFVDGISDVLKTGQDRIQLYAHQLNWGAETATKEYRERFGLKTAFRYQWRAFGTYKGITAIEHEEIVISSNHMNFKEYLRIRELHFFILLLGSRGFKEFQRILKCTDYNIAKLSKFILSEESMWPATLTHIMQGFRKACQDELLSEDDLKIEVDEKDIEEIMKKNLALVPSAICKLFARGANVGEFYNYLVDVVRRYFTDLSSEMVEEVVEAINLSRDRAVCYDNLQSNREVEYQYNLEGWLSSEFPTRLKDFKTGGKVAYRLELPKGLEEAFEKAKKAGTSLENAVYLLKFEFFPLSDDRIFSYIRMPLREALPVPNIPISKPSSDSVIENYSQ